MATAADDKASANAPLRMTSDGAGLGRPFLAARRSGAARPATVASVISQPRYCATSQVQSLRSATSHLTCWKSIAFELAAGERDKPESACRKGLVGGFFVAELGPQGGEGAGGLAAGGEGGDRGAFHGHSLDEGQCRDGGSCHAGPFGQKFFRGLLVQALTAVNHREEGADLGLLAIVLVSLAVGQPFTLQYARERAAKETWGHPLFKSINRNITWAWATAFAVLVAAHAAVVLGMMPLAADIAINLLALAGAIRFSTWYPGYARRKAGLATAAG